MSTHPADQIITTGMARRIATQYRSLGQGMEIFSRTGTPTMLARSELVNPNLRDLREGKGPRDWHGAAADLRALTGWMDANVAGVERNEWRMAWDDTVVPWAYGR
jgi:hypothetical protein